MNNENDNQNFSRCIHCNKLLFKGNVLKLEFQKYVIENKDEFLKSILNDKQYKFLENLK